MFGLIFLALIGGCIYLFVQSKLKSGAKKADRKERLNSEGSKPDFMTEGRIASDTYEIAKYGSEVSGVKAAFGIYSKEKILKVIVENKTGNVEYSLTFDELSDFEVIEQPSSPEVFAVDVIGLTVRSERFPWKKAFIWPKDYFSFHPMCEALGEGLGG